MALMPAVEPDSVAAYIRWSTDEQSEGTTLEVQQDACRHYILAQGWQFNGDLVFVDDGYSGGSMDRPALGALRQAVRQGRIGCVVVYKLDRLSRNVVDTVKLVLEEWEGLCYVKSTREPVDTTTPAGKMFFYMLASYAEWERSVIKERTMSGKAKRAQQGRHPGSVPPYGYALGDKPGELRIVPAQAAVVVRIFHEYQNGRGLHQVAAGLNADGIRPRRARHWHATTLSQMLRNPAYTGVLVYGRTALAPRSLRGKGAKHRIILPEPVTRVEGAYPAIVDHDAFARVQRLLNQRGAPAARRALNPEYLLSGIIRCRCGAPLGGDVRSARGFRYYRCASARLSRPESCASSLLPADVLEATVVAKLREAFAPAARDALLANIQAGLDREVAEVASRLAAAAAELAGVDRRRARLDTDYDAGDLGARLYTERSERLAAEQRELEQKAARLRERLERLQATAVDLQAYYRVAAQVDVWDDLLPEQRKQLLRTVVADLRAFRRKRAPREAPAAAPVEVDLVTWRLPEAM